MSPASVTNKEAIAYFGALFQNKGSSSSSEPTSFTILPSSASLSPTTTETLQILSRHPVYDPSKVLSYGEQLLTTAPSTLVPKLARYDILESCVIAALETGQPDVAKRHLSVIAQSFPSDTSNRTKRLEAMVCEYAEQWDRAISLYQDVLDQDEKDTFSRKRMITIEKSRGKRTAAIELLVHYLDHYMMDIDAWMELCDLYLLEVMFQQALYCIEECMVLNPKEYLFVLRYAEIAYTMGDSKLALKYYCRVLEIFVDNVRALFGVKLCVEKLLGMDADKKKGMQISDAERDLYASLLDMVKERLSEVYALEKTKKPNAVQSVVKSLLEL